jgi:hypothetical protein
MRRSARVYRVKIWQHSVSLQCYKRFTGGRLYEGLAGLVTQRARQVRLWHGTCITNSATWQHKGDQDVQEL